MHRPLVAPTFELVETPDGTDLVVIGPWSAAAARQIISGRANGLVMNYALGFQERTLEFLLDLRLKRIDLLARTITDLSPIYASATTLTSLSLVAHSRSSIDLAQFPRLQRLSAEWPQIHASIQEAVTLHDLYLGSYPEQDLTALSTLTLLTRLRLKDRPQLASLDGLEALPWLNELGVFGANRLTDITALQRMSSPVLQQLELESNPLIPDLGSIANCTALTYLSAGNCGDLPTAAPLQKLHALEALYLYGSTRFLDGDLSPIAQLPRLRDFRMQNRRHYTPPVSAVKNNIDTRHNP